ncbi:MULTISPECIES: ubiquinol-cytochrome c reductase iron-sulfur subunit [Marichromatium]|uniref:Ubiquinol-cytochrome c reductase iron-sulfur subunit n=1 Tax=Marichromatium gracile TaxID=1048 RepID=A0A4R4ADB8_MARGR|nr:MULTISPECIES: ubiquinol-cytochrome c reductase iron-sulfur subunit [Marichromatium]MBO8087590.1 ubiquinol-cytochrome c reductase iron-sulfur subunit [Marichromatium sp.]MBK1709187.1 ubiquinol-cytochrome c reductase iron-sulfur subunit [Marichromatium gracile]RNE91451.1 ubiquinol-cytochrome c reductase iron-sulfur subunit [Marichromatium sp. AB31]RNE92837.1 ubiquinol-cytochrome c reductase iron-sulfur subunit [Marichromatium sp. AB32]TCW37082.1 ubiquinol-cytochrome c reductase iron-sulfur su
MSATAVNKTRRRLLVAATSAVGAVGAGFALVPFVASMNPSARARAAGAPVEADISKIEPGALLRVKWRGKPVWVVHRTPKMLEMLASNDPKLVDPASEVPQQPEYCQNPTRSIKPEYLVAIGICTHLGCSPTYRPEFAPEDLGADWKGGFFCPCHGSRFDLAARVFKGVPAPTNLVIPKHTYLNDTTLLIGEDGSAA